MYGELFSNLVVFSFNWRPHTEGGEFETRMYAQIFRNAREALRKRAAKTLKTES